MKIDPVALVVRYHAAINELDFDAISKSFSPNVTYHSPGIGSLEGHAAVMESFRLYFERFSDQEAVDELVEQTSALSARSIWAINATDSQSFTKIRRHGEETVTFDENGLITSVIVQDYTS